MYYYVRIPRREWRQWQQQETQRASSATNNANTTTSTCTTSTPNQTPNNFPKTDGTDPDVDGEGLSKSGYDVIICGTGLTQSILASALARAGKTVLQCDGNDYYGEMDAVLSLDHMIEWSKERMDKSTKADGGGGSSGSTVVETHPGEEELELEDNEVIVDLDPACGCAGLKIHSTSTTSLSDDRLPSSSILAVGVEVITTSGEGRIISLPTKSSPHLTIRLTKWEGFADGQKKPTAHFGYGPYIDSNNDDSADEAGFDLQYMTTYYRETHNIVTKSYQLRQDVIAKYGRSFALDLNPGLIYATGDAVDGLIKSGVADYLEFKSAEAIHLLMEPSSSTSSKKPPRRAARSTSSRREAGAAKARRDVNATKDSIAGAVQHLVELELFRVPCSKGEVFQTKLLSPVEKRRLMKFLQLASDYAFAEQCAKLGGTAVMTSSLNVNEIGESNEYTTETSGEGNEMDNIQSLNERQLLQGRSLTRPQNKVVSTSDMDTLRDYIDRNVDFDEYLRTVHSLPDRLRLIVIHAMAMESAAFSSLGEHDGAAVYPTGQAMGDLCRHLLSLGRYGSTAFLVPMYGSGELSQSFCRSAAVHGATYLLRRSAKGLITTRCNGGEESMEVSGIVLGGDIDPSGNSLPDKKLKARCVIVSANAMPSSYIDSALSGQRILRRISVLSGKLVVGDDSGDNADTTEQRHIVVIPPNTGNLGNMCVIHGIALDESVSVAPRNLMEDVACTVLHLTTTVEGSDEEGAYHGIMERAVQSLIGAAQFKGRLEELYHISFSYIKHPASAEYPSVRGLVVCRSGGQSITLESAFHRAKQMFDSICPDADFLELSKEMGDMVRDRVGDRSDESDDEQLVLQSAMGLIDTVDTDNAAADTNDTL